MIQISPSFSVRLHRLGSACEPRQSEDLAERDPTARTTSPLHLDVRAFSTLLSQLPGLYSEPDGSFVWTDATESPSNPGEKSRWVLEGTFYEHDSMIPFIELAGRCPRTAWLQFLDAIIQSSKIEVPPGGHLAQSLTEETIYVHDLWEGRWYTAKEFLEMRFEGC